MKGYIRHLPVANCWIAIRWNTVLADWRERAWYFTDFPNTSLQYSISSFYYEKVTSMHFMYLLMSLWHKSHNYYYEHIMMVLW